MAGQLTIWGTTQRDIEPILKEIGIENVDVYNGAEPPIMTNGVLFVVGSQTIPKMANLGVVPKGRTITSLRVNTYELRTNKVRFSYSPSIKNIDSGMFTDLKNDLVLAYRLAMTGSLEPKLGKYKYVEDFSDYCNQLQVLEKEGKKNIPITFDTETIGFDYLHLGDNTRPQARFVSFQLSIKKGESHVVYFKDFGSMSQWLTKNASQLIYLFTDKNLSMGGANFKFDLNWLRHFTGLYCTNFKFDTTLVGSLLDENRSNSLDNHTKIYVPDLGGYADSFNATYDKGRMDLIPQDILLPYAGGDTDACFQVRQRMTLLLKEQPNLANFYINILHPSARAFEELEYQGVYIDRDRYFEVERDLNDEIKNCIHQAVKCIGGRLYAIHKDPKKVGGINIGKASLIEDYLFSPKGLNLKPKMLTEKTGKPVTSAQHLQMFLDVPEARPFIEAFLNYNKASKALSTYVTGFLKHQRSDGRFHPSYFLFAGDKTLGDGGTSTGRLSAHNPAFQTLPKKGDWGKRLRKCFTAPEGYLVTEKDYSQGELRVIACVADEKTMLNAYKQGRDLHIQTGSGLGGITYEQMLALKDTDPDKFDSLRKNAKPANFGLCLHENSQVLTKNKVTNIIKTVRIADIQECHLVWDGVEWVSHDGIIYKGYHEVITYQGVTATPCHEVFTHELGKVTLYEATITNANIIETARGKTPITCGGDIYFESGDPSTDVEGNKRLVLRPRKRELLFLWGERDNRKLSRRKSLLNLGLFDLSVYGTPSDDVHIKKSKQAVSAQQHESYKCKGKRKDPSRTLHRRLPKSISELEYVQSIAKLSSVQKRHLKKLGIQVYKAKVYDILNAGERHRFTADGKLVSNCYGMGANGYMTYAKNNYGVDMTLEEAEQIRHAFLYETYPMLPIYHERYKEIARKTGKIISPLGRVRHLPLINSRDSMVRSGAERQAVNSAIQSTLSDMLCWAMAISHQRGHTKYAPCFGAIHDATYNYVPEDDWEKWTLADKEIMETLPFEKVGWKPQLEFVADAKIGKSMGELYDLEDFKKEN